MTETYTATNVALSALTKASGVYRFPDLTPGRYQAKVTATGFADFVTSLKLQVQQTARVEVSAGAEMLNTENATVGRVIEEKRITDLAL